MKNIIAIFISISVSITFLIGVLRLIDLVVKYNGIRMILYLIILIGPILFLELLVASAYKTVLL